MGRIRGRVARSVACAATFAAFSAGAADAGAYEPTGSDFRISEECCADPFGEAETPAVAYNPSANQYLVVWGSFGDRQVEAQLVSAAGAEVGADFQVSSVAGGGREARNPAVTYNPDANEFLVVWEQDEEPVSSASGQYEVFSRRVSAAGAPLDVARQVSDMSRAATDGSRDALDPAVAYNPHASSHRYLVAWEGDGLVCMPACGDEQWDIWGRELGGADGVPIGSDAVVAQVEDDLDPERDGFNPALAYNSSGNEILIAYEADEDTDNKFEIWSRPFVDNDGGAGSVKISATTGDANFDATRPTAVSRGTSGEYLVAWQGIDSDSPSSREIYGQLVTTAEATTGGEIGISELAAAGRDAQDPMAAYSSAANEFLVTWEADRDADSLFEVFGQRISSTGSEVGTADFQVFTSPSDPVITKIDHGLAYGSTANEYLTVQRSNPAGGDDAFEIYGHRLATAPAPPPTPPAGGETPSETGKRAAALKKCKKKKSARARRKCRKKAAKLPA